MSASRLRTQVGVIHGPLASTTRQKGSGTTTNLLTLEVADSKVIKHKEATFPALPLKEKVKSETLRRGPSIPENFLVLPSWVPSRKEAGCPRSDFRVRGLKDFFLSRGKASNTQGRVFRPKPPTGLGSGLGGSWCQGRQRLLPASSPRCHTHSHRSQGSPGLARAPAPTLTTFPCFTQ